MLETYTITELIALFFGLYCMAAGIGMISEWRGFATMMDDLRDNTTLGFIVGIFTFTLGAFIVSVHNIWTNPLAVAVSLIGWAALIEGLLFLAVRKPFMRAVSIIPFTAKTMIPYGIFAILIGILLIYAAIG